MHAVLIDPFRSTVADVDIEGTLSSIYDALQVQLITAAFYLADNDCCLADDEGLLHGPTHFFLYRHYSQPIAGRGIIVGTDEEGETVSAKATAGSIGPDITFAEMDDVREWFRKENEWRKEAAENPIKEDGFFRIVVPYPDL